jgi:hypothetical protein
MKNANRLTLVDIAKLNFRLERNGQKTKLKNMQLSFNNSITAKFLKNISKMQRRKKQ